MTAAAPVRRPVEPGDEPFLASLFASTRQRELAALPPEGRDAFVALQHRVQRQQLQARYPDAVDDLVLVSGRPVGRLWLDHGPEGTHVVDVALVPEHRSRGIGTALLTPLLVDADRTGRSVTASVFVGNEAALRWYRRLGFAVVEDTGSAPGASAYLAARYPSEGAAPGPGGASENVAS